MALSRDEAHDELPKVNSYMQWGVIHDVIDKIYDDFESRSCENCKYWNPSQESILESNGDGYIDCDIVYAASNGTINKSNFSCNKFESKG